MWYLSQLVVPETYLFFEVEIGVSMACWQSFLMHGHCGLSMSKSNWEIVFSQYSELLISLKANQLGLPISNSNADSAQACNYMHLLHGFPVVIDANLHVEPLQEGTPP